MTEDSSERGVRNPTDDGIRYFYVRRGSKDPVGPVTLGRLRSLAATGEIHADTPVISEGSDEWARYRDFRSAERSREVADAVVDRASRLANALQTEGSKSFGFGLLIGLIRLLYLPWEIVLRSAQMVSGWGASRFAPTPRESIAAFSLAKIAAPLFILGWTGLWMGDVACMLIFGRPSFSFTLLSMVSNLFMLGIGSPMSRTGLDYGTSMFGAAMLQALTVREFSDRLGWAIKIGLAGYSFILVVALIGEFFAAMAALIGQRQSSKTNLQIKNEGT